ncbi:hypothetical protein CWI37_0415p0010 [Hamiltosporidium tvaerminnensis]|uniref:Uncharacterized protein n=1 Tax=Hamiltosporidium tvaerminnensis TaxID=1176355 RepID=A0A4Q9L5L1_9MICR|nr:hypothetical protein LUQ84_002014 [Hamiltosporidium tvaerminnensis]TBU02784.1 hypothetical protein CWI37_0415p0010 [Hamiltosporidium tvaerminnensis]
MTDPTVDEGINIGLSCRKTCYTSVENILNRLHNGIGVEEKQKLQSIINFYMDFVEENTNINDHSFLLKFVSFICYIIHTSDSKNNYKCYSELLFNLIGFGKLYCIFRDIGSKSPLESLTTDLFLDRLNAYEIAHNRNSAIDITSLEANAPVLCKKIKQSCFEGDGMDRCIWENITIPPDISKSVASKLSNFLRNASFDRIFLFYLTIKTYFLLINKETLNNQNFEFKQFKIVLNETFYEQLINLEEWFVKKYSAIQSSEKQQNIMKHISRGLFDEVLNDSITFDSILKFSTLDISKKPTSVDENFPQEFLELFTGKENATELENIYSILKESIRHAYHKYIPIIICLKCQCLKHSIPNSNKLLQIIIELMFFTKILILKNREYEESDLKVSLEKEYLSCLKNIIVNKKIVCEKDINGDPVLSKLVPKTLNLVNTVVHVQYFANNGFLSKLRDSLGGKPTKQNIEKSVSLEDMLKKYFSVFMENELKDVPIEISPTIVKESDILQNKPTATKTDVKSRKEQPEQITKTSKNKKSDMNSSASQDESESQQKSKKKNESDKWKIVLILCSALTLLVVGCLLGYWYFVRKHR